MVMDGCLDDLSFSADDFNLSSHVPLHDPNQSLEFANEHALGFDPFTIPLVSTMPEISVEHLGDEELVLPGGSDGGYTNPSESLGMGLGAGGEPVASSYENMSLDPVFEYISQMIMEENLEDQEWMDDHALRKTEKSLYDALGQQYPELADHPVGSPSRQFSGSGSVGTTLTGTNYGTSIDLGDASELVESSVQINNTLNENDYIMQFKAGLEEANKFLRSSSELIVNSGSGDYSGVDGHRRGRKNPEREDLGLFAGRATKQTAPSVEADEANLSELLSAWKMEPECSTERVLSTNASEVLQAGAQPLGSNKKSSSVDLRALLIQCAQAVSSNDLRTANELLKQIRANSSPSGDGSQRLAHYFANGLQARMERNHGDTQCTYASLANNRRSTAEMLKAVQLHISVCPFMRISVFYTSYMIWKLSRTASVLHIIDFGVSFGFRWPLLIQQLGEQANGPKKLRITGIEFPQPGFRPAERIEEVGRRLARYCESFNVPFEFNALPSLNWEQIKIEDLKIQSGEFIAVSSVLRFKNLLDETAADDDSPRDAVLNLIRRIKPDIYVNTTSNGYYNAPFFVTRFREALYHLSSIYDMLDVTISTGGHKYSELRTVWESEFYGRQVMNAIACEGVERVERPETYKMWQIRHARAGFKQLPLDQAVMNKFRHQLKAWYHKDFALDDDGNWILIGWKGRVLYALTCWVPA